jgi:hypothetical protein
MAYIIMVLNLFLLLSLFCVSAQGYSSSNTLGQRDFPHYFGPQFPLVKYSKNSSEYTFKDDREMLNYFNSRISPELFMLKEFMDKEYFRGHSCPDDVYKNNYDYISYLYRLINLSYLFENLRAYEYTAKQFKIAKICQFNWSDELKKCKPKTIDMKNFKRNASSIARVLGPVHVPFNKSKSGATSDWISSFNKSKMTNVVQYRLASYCRNKSCGKIDRGVLENALTDICNEDINRFQMICSEVDRNYGVSEIPELFNAISQSNALRNISDVDNAQGCLKRYIIQNKSKEARNSQFIKPFSLLYEQKMEENDLQGRLFSLGAMKEFSRKGIVDIFETARVTDTKSVKIIKVIKKSVVPKFEIIKLPKFVKAKRVKKKKIIKKVIVKPKKKLVSSFLSSVNFRRRFKLDLLNIDMGKFKYDYLFTVTRKKILDPVVARFGRYKVLKEMKKHDNLGGKKAPIPLTYIKYLVESRSDQLLFNLINVIGGDFYVLNDIDKAIKVPTKIRLYNSDKSNYQWQIVILE